MKNMFKFYVLLFCLLSIFACGQEPAFQTISLSGTVSGDAIAKNPGKAIMLIVVKSESLMDLASTDLSNLSTSMDEIVEYVSVDRNTLSFNLDLTEKGVNPGDELAIVAFVDVNNNSSIPFPNKGDFLGFYINEEDLTFTYTLQDGENTGLHVDITRELFDFDATVEGTISGDEMGSMLILAYARKINVQILQELRDISAIDIDDFIGYARVEKTEQTQDFALDILPMGKNVPIEDVTLLAFLDINENGIPDAGDRIAYIPDENSYPSAITIHEGVTKNQHLEFIFTIPRPSGYSLPLVGTLEMPDGEYFHKNSPPLYVLVVAMDDLSSLASLSDISSLFADEDGLKVYPEEIKSSLPPEQGERFVDFNIDLSGSTFNAGDNVLVAALWDKDNQNNENPVPTTGDRFGFYTNKDTYKFTITLADEKDAIVNKISVLGADQFKLNKIWYEHNVSIQYRLDREQPSNLNYKIGDKIMVAAVHKDGLPINFQTFKNPTMDIDYLIGLQMITIDKNTFGLTFEMGLLPIQLEGLVNGPGFNIDDVGLFAILGMDGLEFSGFGEYTVGHYYQTGWFGNPIVLPEWFTITDESIPFTMPDDHGIRFFPGLSLIFK